MPTCKRHVASIACTLLVGAIALCADAGAGPSLTKFGVTINDTTQTYPGNVLFVDCSSPNVDGTAKVILINQGGAVIKTWRNMAMFDLAKPIGIDGSIVTWRRTLKAGDGSGCQYGDERELYKISPTNVATKIYYDPAFGQNHDFEVLPDGTFLVLRHVLVNNTSISPVPFYDDSIVRVDTHGNVLWTWSTVDHFSQLALSNAGRQMILAGQPIFAVVFPGETAADVFHTNNIQYIPPNPSARSNAAFRAGNILVDERNTNLVFVIDYATGNIVWQVNNISIGQHHARMIPTGLPGAGHILIFNNGGYAGYPPLTSMYSSVDEYDPIKGTLVWQYISKVPSKLGFNSDAKGSAQRLPNGNTFIDEAVWGRFFEVNPAGDIVWEYIHAFPNQAAPDRDIYRAYKVEACWPGCSAEAGLPGRWTW